MDLEQKIQRLLDGFNTVFANNINRYENKITSQNGEDGIIQELFRRIGTVHPFFVEFGIGDGTECNCAQLAGNYHWEGVLIEGDEAKARQARSHYTGLAVDILNRFIDKDNIVRIFREANVPDEPDLLSIDIDGNDYWVWKALRDYRARVVIIEYNAAFAPPHKWVMSYNPRHVWNGSTYYGASLSSLEKLGAKLGYALIGTESRGINAFFIREDLLEKSGFPKKTAQEAYHPPKFGNHFGRHPRGFGPFEEI